jgi:phosphatidylserine/phosphatidylglycerophosphate/cardiolipin synthase-like enzyme
MALNDESTLMVLDPATGAEMVRLFLDDLQHATEITATGFQRRSWRDRLIERAANLLTRLL